MTSALAGRVSRLAVFFYAAAVLSFLIAPIAIAMVVAFSSGSRLSFPPPGFSLKWIAAALTNPLFLNGIVTSLIIAAASSILATIAGTGGAIAINHYRFRGRALAEAILMLPLAMPAIVLGLGLLFTLSAYGMRTGMLATILGHAVLGTPYAVAMVLSALASYDRALERASLNLGAGPVATFVQITLPLIGGGVAAGLASAFMISFDNVALSLFVSRGDTLPLRLMQQLLSNADPGVAAISTAVVFASFILTVLALIIAYGWGRLRRPGAIHSYAGDEADDGARIDAGTGGRLRPTALCRKNS